MNKEAVQTRIALLERERELLRQNLIAYEGALQECQYWLKVCNGAVDVRQGAEGDK